MFKKLAIRRIAKRIRRHHNKISIGSKLGLKESLARAEKIVDNRSSRSKKKEEIKKLESKAKRLTRESDYMRAVDTYIEAAEKIIEMTMRIYTFETPLRRMVGKHWLDAAIDMLSEAYEIAEYAGFIHQRRGGSLKTLTYAVGIEMLLSGIDDVKNLCSMYPTYKKQP